MHYTGDTPYSRSKACKIIKQIRLTRRIEFIKERAKKRNVAPAVVERLLELVKEYEA
jgi:hypothetical protein